jgi:SAM-dependent methyltransferase
MGDRPVPIEQREAELQLLDRTLRRWRFAKARPYVGHDDRVLDVGCGDGAFFRYLRNRFASGVGVEPNLAQPVDAGRYRLVPGRFPDAFETSERFTVITMLAVLEHMAESVLGTVPPRCLDLIEPGGKVVITVPAPAVDSILHILIRLRLMRGSAVHEHHGLDPWTIPALFTEAGFRAVAFKRFELGLNNLFVFQRL